MNWLARLKKTEIAPQGEPTEPTKAPFVGFVAPVVAPNRQKEGVTEGDRMAARIALFTRRGLRVKDAEELAAAIARRAMDFDDRRTCLECRHLSGKQCARADYAGAGRSVEAIMRLPQRCPAFGSAL